MRKAFLAGLLALACTAAHAITAVKLGPDETIAIDGRLDEPAWQRAPALDRFWQNYPQAEVEAPVRTEARFAFDRHALYVAIRAFDPGMAQLRAPFARRDNVLSDQDMVDVFIDPVGARKFAHFYRVNPRGSIGDGLYNEDSATEDFSPDFDFEVVTGRFEGGWTVEMRIPFSTLRYTDAGTREWSVMVWRNWPREQRYRMATSKLPREQNCFLCLNEPLTGLDVPAPNFLQLTPNATLRSVHTWGVNEPSVVQREFVPSLDVKWRPRADTVLDATLNPDFSQVELDTPQLAGNSQFALFYPEKRPFFLEGADMLQGPINATYTRSVTDPAWGVRATQRRDGFDGTVLVTRDDGGGTVLLPNPYLTDYAVQDFKSYASFARGRWQSDGVTFGAVATDRTIDGGAYNRVAGPDAVWFPTLEHRLRMQLLGSWTTAQAVDGHLVKGDLTTSHAFMADWQYRGRAWEEYLLLEDYGRDFRADNGFVGQNGYRSIYSETTRKFLDVGRFNEVSPYFFAQDKVAPDGSLLYRQTHIGLRFGLPRATTIQFEYRPNDLIAVCAGCGTRKRDQGYFSIESNPWPWFSRLFFESAFGDRLDVYNNRIGRGAYSSFQASVRPHARAEVEYRIDNDTIDSIQAVEGSDRIIGQRVQQLLAIWHFSARDSLRTIWQSTMIKRAPTLWEMPVSPRQETQTLSLVYGHRRRIGTAFYVGMNLTRNRDALAPVKDYQAEFFVKGSWTLDVL
jgi:hypothetical protein